jgi:bacterioferritin
MPSNETHSTSASRSFLTDVQVLRERSRKKIEQGAVTESYVGDVGQTIEILQGVLATEIVCWLRYTQHSVVATGLASEGVSREFAVHAAEEQGHAMQAAQRINQLGGAPDFDPARLTGHSAAEYTPGEDLLGMIRENLVAERIAIDHYRELIRHFADNDPATRVMIEGILSVEEEHASDMVDLLAIHGAH